MPPPRLSCNRFKLDSSKLPLMSTSTFFVKIACHLVGSIEMSKPLPTVLSSAVNKSQQHQEKKSRREKFLGTQRIKPGIAGCKARTISIVLQLVCHPNCKCLLGAMLKKKNRIIRLRYAWRQYSVQKIGHGFFSNRL